MDDYIARMDQGIRGAQDMAELMASFHLRLIEKGIADEAAARITAAYTGATVANLKRED